MTLSDDGIVEASGTATNGAEATRTLWYETIATAAYAQEAGGKTLSRKVVDSAGRPLDEATDRFWTGGVGAFSPITLLEADFNSGIESRASILGLKVVDTTYVDLFGGFGEVVVQPVDARSFVEHAGTQLGALLGDVAEERPYLVEIVDAKGSPLMVMTWNPGVGGDQGQGSTWLAPGLTSDAVIGELVTSDD